MAKSGPVRVRRTRVVAITAVAVALLGMVPVHRPVSAQVRPTVSPRVRSVVGTPATSGTPASSTPASSPASSKTWHSVPVGPHALYGTISALQGAALTLRLRDGRLANIDATSAIANDAFSAPLFVGKMVTVDGSVVNGKFIAAHIVRLTNLTDMPLDR